MANVLAYWRFPEEEEPFLTYLEKTGDIQASVFTSVPERVLLRPRPLRELLKAEEPESVVFGRWEFMEYAPIGSYVHEDGSVSYSRHYQDGPLICYSRGNFRTPRQLGRSNLCFASSCWVSDGANPDLDHSRPQPPEFLSWARNVLSWVRRHTQPYQYPRQRITPRVLAEAENGLELVI